ncbi:hypothetical protein AZF37_02875 [endosymbiont 'TC1' of Trimyema compressum]|uniref:hypothetical protein n=1 Tax=endosymbiont 'TC1' of Trimyema compressum TaxID=243899 RepID=UPI0007F179CE|nr:hypothetical protein [endosymbiont 'TC1' of Trimyema compressum]AMP20256.1 hypothetical protein AZF37_02875 [endosymbiont 'TC1' of Trimyema compressum]
MEIVIILALILIIIIFGLIVDRYGKQKRLLNKELLTLHLEVDDVEGEKILDGRLDDLDVTDIVLRMKSVFCILQSICQN